MYLIDTDVISEARKGARADSGVQRFFADAQRNRWPLFLSVITVGELHRGAAMIRHRGDIRQAEQLETWLAGLLDDYSNCVLDVDADVATVWARLRVPHHENALDKLIAATALIHNLTVVTRNTGDFDLPNVETLNPFDKNR